MHVFHKYSLLLTLESLPVGAQLPHRCTSRVVTRVPCELSEPY